MEKEQDKRINRGKTPWIYKELCFLAKVEDILALYINKQTKERAQLEKDACCTVQSENAIVTISIVAFGCGIYQKFF